MALFVPFTGFLSVDTAATVALAKGITGQLELERLEIVCSVLGTGAGATRKINIRKGGLTGTLNGVVDATLASQDTLGKITVGTLTTTDNANIYLDADTLTVHFPAGGTVFTAGGLMLYLTFRDRAQRIV